MSVPRRSDISVSIRSIRPNQAEGQYKTLDGAMDLLKAVRPDRIEWSYIRDPEQVKALKEHCPLFVSANNTISP